MKNKSSKIFFNISEVSEMTGLNNRDLAEMEIIFNEIKPRYFSPRIPTYQQKEINLINKFKEKYLETKKDKLEKYKVHQDDKPINRLVYENKIPISAKKKSITSNIKWSRKYDYCVSCGRDELRHRGQGLCINCYEENSRKKHINHRTTKIYGDSAKILSMDNLILLYHEKQMSLMDIAKTANCSRQYVYKMLKEYGIDLRDKSKARKIAIKKRKFKNLENYTVNELFFKTWTKEMAYVLGFIYADGNVHLGYKEKYSYCAVARLTIYQKEPEILEKIKYLMGCDKKLYKNKNWPKGFIYSLNIASDSMCNDLLNLGVVPAKSNIIKYPNVPKEYSNHFIRGVFDGDGSVYYDNQKNNICYVSFVSGSETFLKSLQSTINQELQNDACKMYICKRRKGQTKESYQIKILAQSQVYRFFKFLYRDSDKKMYLERKRKMFDVWVENSQDYFKTPNRQAEICF